MLKKYLTRYKPFLLFLSKFFLTYLVLTLIYQTYLQRFGNHEIDGITKLVAYHTEQLVHVFGADFSIKSHNSNFDIQLFYNQKYVARMVEGCNAVSIMVLFVAFVISFSKRFWATTFYVLFGIAAIYVLNVVRVAVLCALLSKYPEYEAVLHRVFFPLFIYGFVFVLWVIWINNFFLDAKKNTKI
ncbi:exosortase family protein XrtF [Flavobacterium sp. UMI-01]|uniref:exosortase family protein XrtF n=1 Tax=Flavobacterium sp. UMI-01 TaxID=1441053 RepID=UPI0020839298|nr:exosortase family protein XrtF [Flavobacterium sp. UMI-01]GIZ08924.1 exosortase family protein XrtF [Flavobacterium sp. UMI-01]